LPDEPNDHAQHTCTHTIHDNIIANICEEEESIAHLFFECIVAKAIWGYAYEFLGFEVGTNYMSVASKWISRERFYVANIISAAVLRGMWLTRNDFVFKNQDRCEAGLKKGLDTVVEMEANMQDVEAGGDEELVFFPGGQDHGSAATPWNLKDQFEGAVRMLVDGAQ
jgi:hypothetical protein